MSAASTPLVVMAADRPLSEPIAAPRDRGHSIQAAKDTTAPINSRGKLRKIFSRIRRLLCGFLQDSRFGESRVKKLCKMRPAGYRPERSKVGVYSSLAEVRSWV